MTDEETYKEIPRAKKLASNIVAAAIVFAAGTLLFALGLATDISMSKLIVPVVLAALGLMLFVSSVIQFNTVSMYLSMLFLVCSAVSFVAHFSPVGYAQLWPTYILAPAIASVATMFMSGDYKFHLRLIVLFGVPAVLLSLMSFEVLDLRVVVPALIMFAGLAALYAALAVRGTTEE